MEIFDVKTAQEEDVNPDACLCLCGTAGGDGAGND